jgi:16S rRNA (cytosine1402-N4)-methyltransferase
MTLAQMISHIPVLYHEVMALLAPQAGGRYIDGTLGAGGHTAGILERSAPDGQVLAFDRDPSAIAFARQQLGELADRVIFVQASFAQMGDLAAAHGFTAVDGILLDLGFSSRQLDDPARGFSFLQDGPLDMRLDPAQPASAADLVNDLAEAELARLFWQYGEEKQSRRLARAIVAQRPVTTTGQLAAIVSAELLGGARERRGRAPERRIHPATRVFQALRIAVNEELAALTAVLPVALELLKVGGRMAVISFHSLEDRPVKQFFRQQSQSCVCPPELPVCRCGGQARFKLVQRKVIQPTAVEIAQNPRSRSARLRVIERLL